MDIKQYYKKHPPEETLMYLGNKDNNVGSEVLLEVFHIYREWLNSTCVDNDKGCGVELLNSALHMDEATPHIQFRQMYYYTDKYGNFEISQNKALEGLGYGKGINAKKDFTAASREKLIEIARSRGVELITEPLPKGWHDFNYWGLHLFLGKFGGGKTISMVRRAYNICKTHHGVTVLTNLTLYGFPEDTKIIKLVNSEQIRDLPDKSIVLVDEIGTIFNSRDFASSKKSVPKPVYQVILQCRHRRIMLLGSVQRWNLLDKQLRDIADTVTECHSYLPDPFSRYTTCQEFDAQQYDKWFANPLLPIRQIGYYGYIQTDDLRSKYDTIEMVEGMLDAEYIPDSEILANRAGADFNPDPVLGTDKKGKKTMEKVVRKL